MKPSHLLALLAGRPWYLHAPVYDRLADLIEAHATGRKAEWRALMEDDDAEPVKRAGEDERDRLVGGIAVIEIRGVLAVHADQVNGECQHVGRSYESIQRQLALAVADPAVHAIVLHLETPGGMAHGCQETYDAIRAADEIKPVHAYVSGYCFSAGMYLAAACRSISVSSHVTEVGSIGTIMALWDDSKAAADAGYKRVVIRAGAYKALIQSGEPITETAIAEEQRCIDAFGAAFHDAVRAGRGLSDEQADAVLNGRCFMAAEAMGLGLVDAISTFDTFLAGLAGSEQQPMFGIKKTTAPTTTQPAAAGASQESTMDEKTQAALAALSESHPTHAAALIKAAMQPGATPESLQAVIDRAELAASKTAIQAAEARAAEAEKKLAEANAALATKDTEIAQLKAVKTLSKTQDPGPDPQGKDAKPREIPLSKQGSMSKADHDALRAGRAVLVDDTPTQPTPSAN
jgi:signal peptide peptidase SppA